MSGAAFVTFSSDYVFDGEKGAPYTERDATSALNAYGISKVAGEALTRRHGERHLIVRTSGVFGRTVSTVKGYTFIDRILRQAESGESPRVVDDMLFSPSSARDVAVTVRALLERGAFGTYHVTNAGHCSWYEFAVEGLRVAGIDARVEAVSSSSFPSAVRRPRFSALAHEALARVGLSVPTWQEALETYIVSRRTHVSP